MASIQFNLNGKPQTVDTNPAMPLLWVLRDLLGLTGTKFGCGMALCGACTVHLNGVAVRSCTMQVSNVAGKRNSTPTTCIDKKRRKWLDVPPQPFCHGGG